MLFERIAQDALNDLIENGVKTAEDRLDDAINYAEDSYVAMDAMFSYNPAVHSKFLAQKAAEEYVKVKIMGLNPLTQPAFIISSNVWAKSAAAEVSNTRDKDWYDSNRFFKNLTTAK